MVKNIDEYFIEEKSTLDKVLDFLVFIAVFVVTIFLILELMASSGNLGIDIIKLTEIYFWVDIGVFIIFLADLIRLKIESDSWGDFFKNNWLDVLATIPFGLIGGLMAGGKSAKAGFEVLKLTRIQKLTKLSKINKISRVSKIAKEFKAASHLKKESENYKKKHRL